MTGEPLEELYFKWLYGQVGSTKRKTHWNLLRQLHTKEFVWVVPNDDNRLEDGRDLRHEFCEDEDLAASDEWMHYGCSMLEMLVALSRRLQFEDDKPAREWFWELMFNLNLVEFTDDHELPKQEIDEILDEVIWRTYQENGQGGLFPLKWPEEDQRDVEIWYQLSAYLQETGG